MAGDSTKGCNILRGCKAQPQEPAELLPLARKGTPSHTPAGGRRCMCPREQVGTCDCHLCFAGDTAKAQGRSAPRQWPQVTQLATSPSCIEALVGWRGGEQTTGLRARPWEELASAGESSTRLWKGKASLQMGCVGKAANWGTDRTSLLPRPDQLRTD